MREDTQCSIYVQKENFKNSITFNYWLRTSKKWQPQFIRTKNDEEKFNIHAKPNTR